jgi:hypothetical protein
VITLKHLAEAYGKTEQFTGSNITGAAAAPASAANDPRRRWQPSIPFRVSRSTIPYLD